MELSKDWRGGPDVGLGLGRQKQSLKGRGVRGLYDYSDG